MRHVVHVVVTLKNTVLDPQGDATLHALNTLGFDNVENVRIGKIIYLSFKNDLDPNQLKELATLMAQKLLCNSVMENFEVQILDDKRSTS
jgi:phosphoribosylformylglycinamidine synthase subunit PurS